jgi:hypothetical protein
VREREKEREREREREREKGFGRGRVKKRDIVFRNFSFFSFLVKNYASTIFDLLAWKCPQAPTRRLCFRRFPAENNSATNEDDFICRADSILIQSIVITSVKVEFFLTILLSLTVRQSW